MRPIDLECRLAQIEATRALNAPTKILTDRAIGDPAGDLEAADGLRNWSCCLALGRATVSKGVLCLVSPGLTDAAWAERYVTEH